MSPSSAGADVWRILDEATDPGRLRPQLADHVEIKEFHLRWGNDYAIVANTRDLLYYRLDPTETKVVKQFDGTRSVAEIAAEHLSDAGDLSFSAFADLTLQLQTGRFFTHGGGDVEAELQQRLVRGTAVTRVVGKLVRSQPIEWQGAERPVAWLYRKALRFAFTPLGAAVLTVIALAGLVAFVRVSRGADDALAGRAPAIEGLVLVVMSYVLTICHELGHALVLVHYGRRVKSAGFTIYFGSPAMFIDSTDGLMLDQKARILQSFGGPFAELVLAGAAALGALRFDGTVVGDTLLRFAILNYFVLFLNLVPLLELDGYWIFSDLIQVPDLRPRSLSFLRHELWARVREWERLTAQEVGLAVYGILGVAFTALSFYGAFFFWRHILGAIVSNLWNGGNLARLILLVLAVVVAGPVLRALIDAATATARVVREWARRVRFRLETPWRVEAAELLDASGRFEDLPVEVLNELAGRAERRSFRPDDAIIRQGDRAHSLFVIRTGEVAVSERDPATGEERSLRTMGRGEMFGELGLLAGELRTASVLATTPTEAFELPKSAFDHLLVDDLLDPGTVVGFHDLEELRQIECFSDLASVDLAEVVDNGEWLQVAAGDVIVRQGESADAFYGVRSGQVEVLVGDEVVDVLGPGAWFGERGLLASGPRQATIRARTPVRAFRLERAGFDRLLRTSFRASLTGKGGVGGRSRQPERRSWEH